jgi:hypothetical protein
VSAKSDGDIGSSASWRVSKIAWRSAVIGLRGIALSASGADRDNHGAFVLAQVTANLST